MSRFCHHNPERIRRDVLLLLREFDAELQELQPSATEGLGFRVLIRGRMENLRGWRIWSSSLCCVHTDRSYCGLFVGAWELEVLTTGRQPSPLQRKMTRRWLWISVG